MENQNPTPPTPVQNLQTQTPPPPPTFQNEPKKGFPIPKIVLVGTILVILLIILIGGGLFLLGENKNAKQTPQTPTEITQTPIPSTTSASNSIPDWKTFTNLAVGYSIQFPVELIFDCGEEGPEGCFIDNGVDIASPNEKEITKNYVSISLFDYLNSDDTSEDDKKFYDKLLNAGIGEKVITPESKGVIERIPNIKIGNLSAKAYQETDKVAYNAKLLKMIFITAGERMFRIRGFLGNADISEELFDKMISTFKLIDSDNIKAELLSNITNELGKEYIDVRLNFLVDNYLEGTSLFKAGTEDEDIVNFYAKKENGAWKIIYEGNFTSYTKCKETMSKIKDAPRELSCSF